MKFLDYFLHNFGFIFLLELGAAMAGTYFLRTVKNYKPETRLFVIYLWVVVIVEFVGLYPTLAYLSNYKILGFVEDTPFARNYWWYNIYHIIKYSIFFRFFIGQLDNKKNQRILYFMSIALIISFVINYIISDSFWNTSFYVTIVGSLYLLVLILLYHFSLLKSNKILVVKSSIEFYISIGLMVWHISITPVLIYNKYFSLANPAFIKLHSNLLILLNIFLYGLIILGYLVCAKLKAKENYLQSESDLVIDNSE